MDALRIAWRNLWRNGPRTAITGAAVALNTAVLIVTIGLTQGMLETTVKGLTQMTLGEAQVHAPEYREERRFHNAIKRPEAICQAAKQQGIESAARSYGAGLASVGNKSSGALFWGVDPARERQAFDLPGQIQQGSYLSDTPPAPDAQGDVVREVVLGRKLANTLHAKVGSELVAVVQAADGSIGNDLFMVKGILKTVSSDVDRSAAILSQRDFAELFVSGGRIHEIALQSRGRLESSEIVAAVDASAGDMEVLTWQKLSPSTAQILEMFSVLMAVFGLIFGLAAGTGVMNSMLMSTFDRMREFGVLKALGATPLRIVLSVACEALVLGLFFGGLGALLGGVGNYYLAVDGINLGTGDDLLISGVAFDPIWKSVLSSGGIIGSLVFMGGVCVVSALYPAIKAARLDPVVAMTEP